jgi:Serpin (serine protease inhibitor)
MFPHELTYKTTTTLTKIQIQTQNIKIENNGSASHSNNGCRTERRDRILTFSDSNLAFSPLFLHLLLGLLTAGTTGPTLQQLLSFLGSNGTSDLSALYSHISNVLLFDGSAAGGPCLRYACGVWVDESDQITLKKSFREIVGSVYKAEIYPVPFSSMVRYILCYRRMREITSLSSFLSYLD